MADGCVCTRFEGLNQIKSRYEVVFNIAKLVYALSRLPMTGQDLDLVEVQTLESRSGRLGRKLGIDEI